MIGMRVRNQHLNVTPDARQHRSEIALSPKAAVNNPKDTVKILMDWTRANEKDALRSLDLAKPGFSKNGLLTDDDLSIEWGFIQQQTKKTNVPVSVAFDMTLLKEVQRKLGL